MSIHTNGLVRSIPSDEQRYHTMFQDDRIQHFLRRQGFVTTGHTPLSEEEIRRRLRQLDQQNTSDLVAQSIVEKALGIDEKSKQESSSDQMSSIVLYENVCAITMQNRQSTQHETDQTHSKQTSTDEILVIQSHTSVGNRVVFKGLVRVGEEFTFKSHRLFDRSFAFSVYINGIIDGHVSACCEEGYLRQNHLQFRRNQCRLVSINGGTPCDACQCNVMMESLYENNDDDDQPAEVVTLKVQSSGTPPVKKATSLVDNPEAVSKKSTTKLSTDANTVEGENKGKSLLEKEEGGDNLKNEIKPPASTVDTKGTENVITSIKHSTSRPEMKKIDNEDEEDSGNRLSIAQSEMQELLTKYLREFTESVKSQPKSDSFVRSSTNPPMITTDSHPHHSSGDQREKASKMPGTGYIQSTINEDNAEGFCLVWLDEKMNENQDMCQSEEKLRGLVNSLRTYKSSADAMESIRKVQQQRVFLIVSGKFAGKLLGTSQLDGLTFLDSIYIFCRDEAHYKHLLTKDKRARGIHTNIDQLCVQVKEDIKQILNDLLLFSVSSSEDDGTSNLNQDEDKVKFLCSQLHRDLLFTMEYRDDARFELVRFCENIYRINSRELTFIKDFEHNYHTGKAIWWYTQETFLYKMLNAALLRQDVKMLCKFHFFIKDLHMQIEQLHSLYKQSLKDRTFTVFRGLRMPKKHFEEKIRQKKKNLIAFDNFLSTSLRESVARGYAICTGNDPKTDGVLLRITINPDELQRPFADITRLSAFGTEDEILFSVGTVFRITDVAEAKDKDGVWLVELTSVSENDELFKNDTQQTLQTLLSFFKRVYRAHAQTQNQIHIASSLTNIARMYYKRGDYSDALTYYQRARDALTLSTSYDPLSMATYESNIAMVYHALAQYDEALKSYDIALNIRRQHCKLDDPILINTFRSIGDIFFEKTDWNAALQQYEQARRILLSSNQEMIKIDPQLLAATYIDSALVYQKLRNVEKALADLSKARDYQLKFLPDTHPILAFLYNHIGAMNYRLQKYDAALENHLQCLKIEQGSLPEDHFAFVSTYRNISTTYEKLRRYVDALNYAERAVKQSKLHRQDDDSEHQLLIRHVERIQDQLPL